MKVEKKIIDAPGKAPVTETSMELGRNRVAGRRGMRGGPRDGTGPRARAGLCSGITAADQIAACGR